MEFDKKLSEIIVAGLIFPPALLLNIASPWESAILFPTCVCVFLIILTAVGSAIFRNSHKPSLLFLVWRLLIVCTLTASFVFFGFRAAEAINGIFFAVVLTCCASAVILFFAFYSVRTGIRRSVNKNSRLGGYVAAIGGAFGILILSIWPVSGISALFIALNYLLAIVTGYLVFDFARDMTNKGMRIDKIKGARHTINF